MTLPFLNWVVTAVDIRLSEQEHIMKSQLRILTVSLIIMPFSESKLFDIGNEAIVNCRKMDLIRVQSAVFYNSRKSSSIYTMEFKMKFSKKNPGIYHLYSSKYKREYKRYIGRVYRPNRIQLCLTNLEPLDASNFTCIIKLFNGTELSLETHIQVRGKV